MINKEDLDTIINDVTWSYEESDEKVPQNILDTLNEIKQMFGNQPTFDECIKMWKDAGWYYSTSKEYGNHIFYKDGTYIKIFKREGIYNNSYIKESYYADCEGPLIPKPILPEEHNLIHKTLKALGMEK